MWTDLLMRKGWLRRDGYLELPPSLTSPPGNGDWRTLNATPDDKPYNKVSKCFSPISRVADHLVCCHMDDADLPFLTKRQKTEYRLNLTTYKKRCFTDDLWQAA